MNQNKIPALIAKLNICIFTFLILWEESVCLDDYYYRTCVPIDCGDVHNISYPFYIQGLQKSFCGYPGFELSCSTNGYPLLHLPENDFIVQQINYQNRSIRLLNAAVSNSSNSCSIPKIRNITLDVKQYKFENVSSNLVLLSNCPERLPENLLRYRIGCNGNDRELAMLENDTNLRTGMKVCGGEEALAPVELYGEEGRNGFVNGGNYKEVLRRGFLLKFLAVDCTVCERSGGRCGFNESTRHFQCFCPDRTHAVRCQSRAAAAAGGGVDSDKTKHRLIIIITAIVGSAFILTLCLVIFLTWRRYNYKWSYFPKYFSSKKSSRDLEDGSVYFGVPVFSYTELEDATNNFDPAKELGDGGFGAVYYGKLRDGREVAVKRLYENNYKRVEQFMNEVDILTRLRHRNLVLFYGCTSRRSRELLLVYEYVPNGTVADHLHGDRAKPNSLTWPIRMNIAIKTASALAYLHASEIIHRDVKTNNILLDENFNVKVADFGLSRLLPNNVSHVSTAPQGTPGYVDPDYHQCYQLTDKSDVYSFGVVLIELISSMPAVDISRHRDEINLANLAITRIQRCAFNELIDPCLGFETNATVEQMTTSVAELAFRCLQFDKEVRPTMKEALEVLKEIQDEIKEGNDSVGELTNVKPPPSPEMEDVVLLKNGTFPPSPISVTDKWLSSRSTTPSTSG